MHFTFSACSFQIKHLEASSWPMIEFIPGNWLTTRLPFFSFLGIICIKLETFIVIAKEIWIFPKVYDNNKHLNQHFVELTASICSVKWNIYEIFRVFTHRYIGKKGIQSDDELLSTHLSRLSRGSPSSFVIIVMNCAWAFTRSVRKLFMRNEVREYPILLVKKKKKKNFFAIECAVEVSFSKVLQRFRYWTWLDALQSSNEKTNR